MGRNKLLQRKSKPTRFDNSDNSIEFDEFDGFYDIDLNAEKVDEQENLEKNPGQLKLSLSLFKRKPLPAPQGTIQSALNSIEDLLDSYVQKRHTILFVIQALQMKEFDYIEQTPEEDQIVAKVKRFVSDADLDEKGNSELKLEYSQLLHALEETGMPAAVRALAFRAFHQKWMGDFVPQYARAYNP